jgi:uncharacterized protein (TIGR03437 family)
MPKRTICMFLAAVAAYPAPYTARVVAGSDWIGDNGPSRDSLLFQAEGLAADREGNLYISDAQAHRVRQITPAGIIRTVAGTGVAGFSGDGGAAGKAQLSAPYGLAVDSTGNLFIADLGNRRIRRVARDGIISTVAAEVAFRAPRNVAVDAGGNLYVSDFDSGSVYRIGASGTVSVVALLKYPAGLALDRTGTLFVGETGTHLVRKLDNGVVRTVATVQTPTGLAFDTQGTLHVADAAGGGIFRIPVTGTAPPLAISARDVASGPGNVVYATDGKLVRSIVATGNVVIAGRGDPARGDYGPAAEARLNHPTGLALDGAGNLFIADRDNQRVRRVDRHGIITTYAGSGRVGNSGDGGPAAAASLNQPAAISLDSSANLYIADQGNGRIRMVTPSGVLFAATSMPKPADIFPPGLQIDVPIQPSSIIAGKDGVLYASDAERDLVWELTPPTITPDPTTLVTIVNAASLTGPLAPGMLARVEGVAISQVLFNGLVATAVSNSVVVVPEQLSPGTVTVEIRDAARVEVAVVAASPALFVAVNEDGTVNDAEHAAQRGSVLVLYGTGQGIEARPVSVRLSAYEADVLYSGPVAGYPGLWQVNARVPSGFFAPGTHALTVGVGDAASPPLTVRIN